MLPTPGIIIEIPMKKNSHRNVNNIESLDSIQGEGVLSSKKHLSVIHQVPEEEILTPNVRRSMNFD